MRDLRTWQAESLANLLAGGPVCQHAARYIIRNSVEIGFARQSTAARWTLGGKIELSSAFYSLETDPASPASLGSIVHEATHLEQGAALALTVAGEVGGWRVEYEARRELGRPIGDPHWGAVYTTPEIPTRGDLRQARREMLRITSYRYLIWLLPLQPNLVTRGVEAVQTILWRKSRA
ncbi:MAG: hypothetical protein DRI77_08840 [Chloroflexi bacterium]|nr:MAG: hypothetical protein DRI77_08840 [Chloroflexota bacterium]